MSDAGSSSVNNEPEVNDAEWTRWSQIKESVENELEQRRWKKALQQVVNNMDNRQIDPALRGVIIQENWTDSRCRTLSIAPQTRFGCGTDVGTLDCFS